MLQQCEKGGSVGLWRGMVFLNKHISLRPLIPPFFFFFWVMPAFAQRIVCFTIHFCSAQQADSLPCTSATVMLNHAAHTSSSAECHNTSPLVFKCNTASTFIGYLQCCCSQGHNNPVSDSRLQLLLLRLPGFWACLFRNLGH